MDPVLAMEILMALEGQEPMTFEDLMRLPQVRMEKNGHTLGDLCRALNALETRGRVRSFLDEEEGERLYRAESRLVFALDPEQTRKAVTWMDEHKLEHPGAIGGQFSFLFTQTSLGTFTRVISSTFSRCPTCSQPERIDLDLTDYEIL